MLSLDLNKKSNLLQYSVINTNDFKSSFDTSLKKDIVDKFINKMVLKNWEMNTNNYKLYSDGNTKLIVKYHNGEMTALKKVFIQTQNEIKITADLSILPIEYNEKKINSIDFACKQNYHSETNITEFEFKNPSSKIIVKVINNNRIIIDLYLDHDRDINLRIVNEIMKMLNE
jgi:hypothetical protein